MKICAKVKQTCTAIMNVETRSVGLLNRKVTGFPKEVPANFKVVLNTLTTK